MLSGPNDAVKRLPLVGSDAADPGAGRHFSARVLYLEVGQGNWTDGSVVDQNPELIGSLRHGDRLASSVAESGRGERDEGRNATQMHLA